jgi:hypothetical protein
MQVQARFRLDQVNRSRGFYKQPGSTEDAQSVESAYVHLNAVQGEPFGAYTPTGHMEMLIVNPTASQVFLDAPIGTEFDFFISPVPVANSAESDHQ